MVIRRGCVVRPVAVPVYRPVIYPAGMMMGGMMMGMAAGAMMGSAMSNPGSSCCSYSSTPQTKVVVVQQPQQYPQYPQYAQYPPGAYPYPPPPPPAGYAYPPPPPPMAPQGYNPGVQYVAPSGAYQSNPPEYNAPLPQKKEREVGECPLCHLYFFVDELQLHVDQSHPDGGASH